MPLFRRFSQKLNIAERQNSDGRESASPHPVDYLPGVCSTGVGLYRSPPPAYNMQNQPGMYPRLDSDSLARVQRGEIPMPQNVVVAGPGQGLPSYTMATRGQNAQPFQIGNIQQSNSAPIQQPQVTAGGGQMFQGGVPMGSVRMANGPLMLNLSSSMSTPNLQGGQQIQLQNGATAGITIPIILQQPQPAHMQTQSVPVAMAPAPVPSGPLPSRSTGPAPTRPPPPAAEALHVPGAPPRYSLTTASSSPEDSGKKISYMDFVPQLQTKRTFRPDKYEPFSILLERANQWLESHGDVTLISCETVVWSGLKVEEIFSDNSTAFKSYDGSMNSKKSKTYYLRGLRMWYSASEVPRSGSTHAGLYCETFLPRDENTKLKDLIEEANAKRFPGGKVLSVECMPTSVPESAYNGPANADSDLSYWSESPSDEKKIVIAIRIYVDMNGEGPSEKLALKTFVPKREPNVNPTNMGYETYPEVFRRAARWITQQVDIRPCSIQTTPVKIKKKGDFEERTVFTEHASSTQKFSNSDTNYLSVIRIFYLKQQIPFRSDIPRAPAPRLTLRTFLPSAVPARYPLRYEEFRKITERINQWHRETGARVHSIETIRIRGVTSDTKVSEAATMTFSTNSVKKFIEADEPEDVLVEKWLYAVRVFLSGDYSEPAHGLSLTNPDRQG